MKKLQIKRLCVGSMMAVSLVMTACSGSENKDNTAKGQQKTTVNAQTESTANAQAEAKKETDLSNSSQTDKAAQTQNNGNSEEVVGVSAKGYSIQKISGITYVNGVLIANKTYALPKSYAPGDISSEVKAAFEVMQKEAAKQGLNLYISSGYRSYTRQNTLYTNYVNSDGKQLADTYSARPGHSEHQTGLCFDLNTIEDSFANTKESAWLEKHAQEYGFIIRYPKGKENITGYQYEPWHLRYLGVDLATKVYESGLCLEEYLGITSEYQN